MNRLIATAEDLDARLALIGAEAGDERAFEDAVHAIGVDLAGPVRWTALLRLAHIGLESLGAVAPAETTTSPAFLGRPASVLPRVAPSRRTDGPRRSRAPDESVLDYGRYLESHLATWLEAADVEPDDDERAGVTAYVALLARDDVREIVGWQRSLDAHSLMMLSAERAMIPGVGLEVSAPVEAAYFTWLHLASFDSVTQEHLAELAARREVRLSHRGQPAVEVAVMVCETPLPPELPLAGLTDRLAEGWFTAAQVERSYRELASRDGGEAVEWAARARGFEDTGALELSPAHTRPDLPAYAAGHLVRWLLDHQVPVGPLRMRRVDAYAREAVDTLVDAPARLGRESISPTVAHRAAVEMLGEPPVPLAEELALLAWLCAQTRLAIHLGQWLDERASSGAGLWGRRG